MDVYSFLRDTRYVSVFFNVTFYIHVGPHWYALTGVVPLNFRVNVLPCHLHPFFAVCLVPCGVVCVMLDVPYNDCGYERISNVILHSHCIFDCRSRVVLKYIFVQLFLIHS